MRKNFFVLTLLTGAILPACGLRLNETGETQQVLIPVGGSVKVVAQKGAEPTQLDVVYSEFYFGKSLSLSSLAGDVNKLVYAGKLTENETIFSLSDGSPVFYDELAKKSKRVPVAESQSANLRRIVFPKGEVWSISDQYLSHTQSDAPSLGGETQGSPQQVIKAAGDFRDHAVLFADTSRLITRSADGLRIISREDKGFAMANFKVDSLIGKAASSAIAAGFTPSDREFWLVTPTHAYFFKRVAGGFSEVPVSIKLKLGLPDKEVPLKMSIGFNDEFKIQGQVVLFSQSGVFLSGQIPADLSWDAHVKPLSDKYCISCHSSTVKSFGRADVQENWIAAKDEIRNRVSSTVNPMPPSYSNLSLSELEKKTIESWLTQTAGSDVSVDPGVAPTPTPVVAATPVPLPPISLSFGQNEILSGVETVAADVLFISKESAEKTVFSMSDGSAYIYDEAQNNVSSLPAPLVSLSGTKTYLVGALNGWRISADKVESFAPTISEVVGGLQKTRKIGLEARFNRVSFVSLKL